MSKKKNANSIGRGVGIVLNGTFLTREKFGKLFVFLVYVAFLLIVLIRNTYQAEHRTSEITKNARLINDLRVENIQLKSDIMQHSKQSELSRYLAPLGIKATTDPLKKITVENQ